MLRAFPAAAHTGARCAAHHWQHVRGATGRKTRSPSEEGTTPHGRRHPSPGLSPSFSGSARPPQRRPQGRPFPAIAGGSRWARGRAMAAGRCWLPALVLAWGCAGMAAATFITATPPVQTCSELSYRSCEECLKNVSCLWCYTNNTCIDYPVRSILPSSSLCSLSNARWGVCWINFEALIIAIAVIAGLILVSIAICCCYCCYCRKRSKRRDDEEEQLARKREERRLQSLQRKHERKQKHDEIRKKYGLLQDSDNPYSRFENE